MSYWERLHLDDTVKALATPDNHRFFIQIREPVGESRNPIEFFRWTLTEAQDAADRIVQAYYPHHCDTESCGTWQKVD